MKLKRTLANFLSQELSCCKEDIFKALTKFEDEYED